MPAEDRSPAVHPLASAFVPINGAGTVISGGTVGGQFLANVAGQTLTVEPAAFDGLPEANGAGATLLLESWTDGASGFLECPRRLDLPRTGCALEQGGTLVLPGTITEVLGSTISTPEVTLDGAGSVITAGGEPLRRTASPNCWLTAR